MEKHLWNKLLKENTLLKEANSDVISKKVSDWIETTQNKYEKFLDSLLLGKSIHARAMKLNEKGHNWKDYDILNIKKVEAKGGYFFTEVSVQDKNGDWYTLLKNSHSKFI